MAVTAAPSREDGLVHVRKASCLVAQRETLRRGGWLRAFSVRSVPHAQGDRPRAMFENCNHIADNNARSVCLPARVGLEPMSEE